MAAFDVAPSKPHEVYPAADIADRMCGSCVGFHVFDDHGFKRRLDRMPCLERDCKCLDFRCYEHPDNSCDPLD